MINFLLKIGYLKSTRRKSPESFSFWQVHHYSLGWVALTICFYLIFQLTISTPMGLVILLWVVTGISLWIIVDDILQHIVQYLELRKNKWKFYSIVSFWHWFPGKLGLYKNNT